VFPKFPAVLRVREIKSADVAAVLPASHGPDICRTLGAEFGTIESPLINMVVALRGAARAVIAWDLPLDCHQHHALEQLSVIRLTSVQWIVLGGSIDFANG
jgi:hypothetical protein